ncbi:hypothetical protein [Nostoc sp.]|uniref:hypothetical protein n=1 Tax=Nostoc sp. TaxID=1180 RepID=UPI002FFC6E83
MNQTLKTKAERIAQLRLINFQSNCIVIFNICAKFNKVGYSQKLLISAVDPAAAYS